jgi:hypothetical protein
MVNFYFSQACHNLSRPLLDRLPGELVIRSSYHDGPLLDPFPGTRLLISEICEQQQATRRVFETIVPTRADPKRRFRIELKQSNNNNNNTIYDIEIRCVPVVIMRV